MDPGRHEAREQLLRDAAKLIVSRQHDRAIALLTTARESAADDPQLIRQLGLAYGGKAEHFLHNADLLQVRPSDIQLDWLEAILERAIAADPTLADPYWDLAVIGARFRRDFAAARRHLSRALALGYHHPMMPRLAALISKGESGEHIPLETGAGTDAEVALKTLVLQLITTPDRPLDPLDPAGPGVDGETFTGDETFDSYCTAAIRLVRDSRLTVDAFERVRDRCRAIRGDAADYASDLLRIVAREFDDPALLKEATEDYLRVLATGSLALGGDREAGKQQVVRARRVAERGLKVLEETKFAVDPDVHADLLIALGQAYAHRSVGQVGKGVRQYRRALDLKETAQNHDDVKHLKALLGRMIKYLLQGAVAPVFGGGLGRVYDDLVSAYEAAQALGDDELDVETGLALSTICREVQQPQEAERVLRRLHTLSGLTVKQRWNVRFELASALSEQGRGAEAARLQEELLQEPEHIRDPELLGTLWLNLGNSRRVAGDRAGARQAFERTLETLPAPAAQSNQISSVQQKRLGATALLAELDFLDGRPYAGHARLVSAEEIIGAKDESLAHLEVTNLLHFHSLAARCYIDAGMLDHAARHVEKARTRLQQALGHGPSLPVWESMLQQWSYLDAYDVRLRLADGSQQALEAALISAERAKGRLLAWLGGQRSRDAGYRALDAEQQLAALVQLRTWVDKRPGRRVVSLLADEHGLAVISLGEGGKFSGRWLDDFKYSEVASGGVVPWEDAIKLAAADDDAAWDRAGALTEALLERTGAWLSRAVPELTKGGDDLIVIPHRLFRGLPLMHCYLPDGRRLGDVFRRVVISPVLSDATATLDADTDSSPNATSDRDLERLTALVDSDGTLPLTRLEGFSVAGAEATRYGPAVTVSLVRAEMAGKGVVLLSCHGDFREDNPWASTITAADGTLALHEVITDSRRAGNTLVVLGVCEAGRSRRSVSDEPLGFPAVLVRRGVRAVVAPLWPIDDFTAFLFVTQLFKLMRHGRLSAPEAVAATAGWLRELTPADALAYTRAVVGQLEGTPSGAEVVNHARPALQEALEWLGGLSEVERPFSSPLDWAAFQVTGALR